jgi:hypothetical protein
MSKRCGTTALGSCLHPRSGAVRVPVGLRPGDTQLHGSRFLHGEGFLAMLGLIYSLVEAFPPDDDCPCWTLQGMADAEGCFVCCGGQKHVQTTDPLVPRLQVRSTCCTVASTMV